MSQTRDYILYRYGSNAANQSMTMRAVVGIVTAGSPEEAVADAYARPYCTVYNNQHLTARAFSRAPRREQASARRAAENQKWSQADAEAEYEQQQAHIARQAALMAASSGAI